MLMKYLQPVWISGQELKDTPSRYFTTILPVTQSYLARGWRIIPPVTSPYYQPPCLIWPGGERYSLQPPHHHTTSLSVSSGQELKDTPSRYLTTIQPVSLSFLVRSWGYSHKTYIVLCRAKKYAALTGGLAKGAQQQKTKKVFFPQ